MSGFWKPNQEVSKSELALFLERPTQTDIEDSYLAKVHPLTNVQGSSGPIEFHIRGSERDYIDMDNTFLCLRTKVKLTNGNDLPDNARIAPANNWMHTLFSDITCHLGDTQIEGGSHLYPYKAYLTNLLLYGEGMKKCQLQTSGFAKDTAGHMNDTENIGWQTRQGWVAGSRLQDLVGPLHLDICQQGKLILSQLDIRIKLTRSQPAFNMMSYGTPAVNNVAAVAPTECRVDIEDAYLLVRRVQVAENKIREHETSLALQNAVYPIQNTEVYTYTIANGLQSHVQDNLFSGKMPKMMILGMVRNTDFNGSLPTNPFQFRHCNLNSITLTKDGIPTPHTALTPNFANGIYAEEYMHLMDSLDLMTTDADINITKNDFGNGYTLFAYNLSPDKVIAGHAQPKRDANLSIEVKFSAALTNAINVIVLAIFDEEIEVTRLRKVIMSK